MILSYSSNNTNIAINIVSAIAYAICIVILKAYEIRGEDRLSRLAGITLCIVRSDSDLYSFSLPGYVGLL